MNNPLISIVTVVYNGVNSLEQTILSVINQTYKNIEYIIIDGDSTDGTVDVIKKYKENITIWVSEPDKGIYFAMNKGLKMANGNWILFLGSDDLFYTNTTLNVCQTFKDDYIYYGNVILKNRNKIYRKRVNSAYQLILKNICHQAIFYPKNIYKNFKYDSQYNLWADYVYNLILYSKFKKNFIYLNLVISIFNDRGLSQSKDSLFFKNQFDLIKTLFGKQLAYIVKFRFFITNTKRWILENF